MSLLNLFRPHLLGLEPYRSARGIASEAKIFLDANESPVALSPEESLLGMNRYPSPQPRALVTEAARYYGVNDGQILITRGADEGIDLLVRSFVEPGREEILVTPPTYGVYAIAAALHGAGIARAPLLPQEDFRFDPLRVLAACSGRPVKIIFICRPNNPTGASVPLPAVEAVAREVAGRALVVVDEAYLEFSAEASAATLISRFPHVIVLKTLSKAWGLAGARCGFILADERLVKIFQSVRAPYPISAAAQRVVSCVFNASGEEAMRRSVARTISERSRLQTRLLSLSCVTRVLPSAANFLTVCFKDKDAVLTALRRQDILVRDRSNEPELAGAIRITIGLPEENDAVVNVLRTLYD
jgi:histidinol-phosphate aminotransferase